MGFDPEGDSLPTLQEIERMGLETLVRFWRDSKAKTVEYRLTLIELALKKITINRLKAIEKKLDKLGEVDNEG